MDINCLNETFCAFLSFTQRTNQDQYEDSNPGVMNESSQSSALKPLYTQKPFLLVMSLSISSLFVIIVNLRVIYVAIDSPGRKLSSISQFVVNFSCICIGFAFLLGVYSVEKLNVIGIGSQHLCRFLSFGRNLLYAAYPLNVVGIIYERVSTFRETERKLLAQRTILFIWTFAGISGSPALFWIHYEFNPTTGLGKCKQVNMFGSFFVTVAFGVWRLIVLHFLVTGYMCSALFKIRSKLRFLYICKPIPTRRIRNTVRRLRFIYFYSIFFIVVWFPTGFILFIISTGGRAGVKYAALEPWVALLFTLNYTYMGLGPFLFALLYENKSHVCLQCSCLHKNSCEISNDDEAQQEESVVNSENVCQQSTCV